ncbi:YicC/YloC family endoribonuclease [Haloimpatiens sp. FM7315]|uniref:YicC/YloC family endoribonuclease n=1 Tax=Haloimpatiens sp. FM7315 TaxID=3298609 RepID=UPI0035A39542
MIKSMTGFGRAFSEGKLRNFQVEIKTVNHRYLDINIRLPKVLLPLEDKIRKLIGEKIKRGKVDVFITQDSFNNQEIQAVLNKNLADSYLKCLREIKDEYEVRDDISVSLVARFPDVVSLKYEEEDLDKMWYDLKDPINSAIDLLINMRAKEGQKLYEDVISRCDKITGMVSAIKKRAPLVPLEYKQKLNQRLKELLEGCIVDENRLAMEVALFSDKACVDEEIVRLNSHINQMKQTMNLSEPIGRKLDFIIQEMNREANTIGSKANDIDITNLVLSLKSEIEKIREQIQNVE